MPCIPAVTAALAALHQRLAPGPARAFDAEYDAQWRSPCELGQPYTDLQGRSRTAWQPVSRLDGQGGLANDFSGLEAALDVDIHPDFKAYYSSYWSAALECQATEGHVSLLQLWNPEDVDRLIENQIGHVLTQRRARAPLTLFIACTEPDSDLILSLHNDSGAVLLERPGRKPLRQAAPSLSALLQRLSPAESAAAH